MVFIGLFIILYVFIVIRMLSMPTYGFYMG